LPRLSRKEEIFPHWSSNDLDSRVNFIIVIIVLDLAIKDDRKNSGSAFDGHCSLPMDRPDRNVGWRLVCACALRREEGSLDRIMRPIEKTRRYSMMLRQRNIIWYVREPKKIISD